MAFNIKSKSTVSLDTPEKMFQDFSERKIPGILTYQGQVLSDYEKTAVDKPNVAIKLPTGSGKTLVALLIGEWRRRNFGERVVYLCPTNQLVHQVVDEARAKYGMGDWVAGFTGSQKNYDPVLKAKYTSGQIIAVTSYKSLFNSNPFFDEPHCVILDDAHAAESNLGDFWTLSISRDGNTAPLFQALAGILAEVLPPLLHRRLLTPSSSIWDYTWVDLVPQEHFALIQDKFIEVLDSHVQSTDLRYPWSVLRNNLSGCQLYVGTNEVVLRPFIVPTQTHRPFADAKQRVYISATLGEGGDLERLTGQKEIFRLPVPQALTSHGVGRRFFAFPGRALKKDEQVQVELNAIKKVPRAVMLVPDFRSANKKEAAIKTIGSLKIFKAHEIEESKQEFIDSNGSVAIMANRYDGIDFAGDQCRMLIVDGLPGATNLQERFLISRMGSRTLFLDRLRTRVIQAVGRCTRSPTDFSAVLIFGEDLLTYLSKKENRELLHPELQAEIEFGLDQSNNADDILDNLDLFYSRGVEWKAAENEIMRLRGTVEQKLLPQHGNLTASVRHEVDFQQALWMGDGTKALEAARKVLTELTDTELRGYRAWWNYLAGCAASLLARQGSVGHEAIARDYYMQASKAMPALGWLRSLTRSQDTESSDKINTGASASGLIERVEKLLCELGTRHDQKYNEFEKEILEGIASSDADTFEAAHVKLGQLLGFEADNSDGSGAPDPWWIVDGAFCIVFEDNSNATDTSKLSVNKVRQAVSHPNWIRANLGFGPGTIVEPILISPKVECESDAHPHLSDLVIWNLDEFRAWAVSAVHMMRHLRSSFPGEGDMIWRTAAMEAYAKNGVDPLSLRNRFSKNRAQAIFQKPS